MNKEAEKWAEGGAYRIVAHTLYGALSGGVEGAAAAGVQASVAQNLDDLQLAFKQKLKDAGVGDNVADALATATFNVGAYAAGNAIGGNAGAATAMNVDANNRQLHPDQIKLVQRKAKKLGNVCPLCLPAMRQ